MNPRRCPAATRFRLSTGKRKVARCVFEADGHQTHYSGYYEPGRWGIWWDRSRTAIERVTMKEGVL